MASFLNVPRLLRETGLVQSYKVTFAAVWGQSSLKCQKPSCEFVFWRGRPFPSLGTDERSLTSQHVS